MKWIGPEYWANPLQDWELKQDKTICKVSQPNRSLHLLTLQKPLGLDILKTSVTITPYNFNKSITGRAGIRLGAKGAFKNYRSAAVFGKGLDIGITSSYSLQIGKRTIQTNPSTKPDPIKLSIEAIPENNAYTISVLLIDPKTGEKVFMDNSTSVPPETLEGNFALVADFKGDHNSGKSVAFEDWEISADQLYQNGEQLYGPICFAHIPCMTKN